MTSPLDVLLGAQVKDDGVAVTPRRYIDFRTGLTLSDDPATDSIRVSATGGGGGDLVGDVNGPAGTNVVTKITGDTGDVEMIASSLSWGSPGNSQLKVNAVDGAIELWNNAILALKAHATDPTIANAGAVTQIVGGVRHSVRTISSNIALDSTTKDFIGWVDASAPRTITLPAPSTGRTFLLVNVGASAVTLARHAAELINGIAANYVVPVANCIVQIVTNGTDWFALPIFDATSAGYVPSTRTISTTAPLTGGGDLSANRTLAVSNATTIAVGVIQLAGDLSGASAAAPTVKGLTGTANVVAMHGTDITPDAGAAGRLHFSSTGVSVPVGTFSCGSNTAQVLLDSYGAFGATHSAIWLGTAAATTANVALAGNNTNTTINANTSVQVAQGGTVNANFTSSGLRVGDGTTATEKLDVVSGAAKVSPSAGNGNVIIRDWTSSNAYGAIYLGLGATAPSNTNVALFGNGANTFVSAPSGFVFLRVNGNDLASLGAAGFRVGDSAAATEKLHVVGNALVTGFIQAGTNPASAGQVRIPNNTAIASRNQANDADLTIATVNTSNNIILGQTAVAVSNTEIQSGLSGAVRLAPNGSVQLQSGTTGNTLATTTTGNNLSGFQQWQRRTTSSDITIDTTTKDTIVLVDASVGARNITLPPPTDGRALWIKRSAGTNSINIFPNGSEKCDNQTLGTIVLSNGSSAGVQPAVGLVSNGTDWFIISSISVTISPP